MVGNNKKPNIPRCQINQQIGLEFLLFSRHYTKHYQRCIKSSKTDKLVMLVNRIGIKYGKEKSGLE